MRQRLDGGGWFDGSEATVLCEERRRFDGNNMISEATGSQWEHERILRTAKGALVLHTWSQWQGSRPSYRMISAAEAARWCAECGDTMPVELEELASETEL